MNNDELANALDGIANVLGELTENPFNLGLHIKHINAAQSLQDDSQVGSACEMMASFFAAGDEVWLPRLDLAYGTTDFTSQDSIIDLLAMYELAEGDYLSIPILAKHLQFVLDQHEQYHGEVAKERPVSLGEVFSTDWTRDAIASVVQKANGHISMSSQLWDKQRDWLLKVLEMLPQSEKPEWITYIDKVFALRLNQPHDNNEETFQAYSSFITSTKPASEYEQTLLSASKARGRAVKYYDRWEPFEQQLRQSQYSLHVYSNYIQQERRSSSEVSIVSALYERAIAEAAKRRFEQGGAPEGDGEQALRTLWIGYLDRMRMRSDGSPSDASQISMDSLLSRAVRSIPSCGEVWARYIRYMERSQAGPNVISEAYSKAISANLIQKDAEQIIPLVLARAGYEKRQIETEGGAGNALENLLQVLESGIEMVRQASPAGDSRLVLEKYLTDIYLHLVDLPEKAIEIWRSTTKNYKSNYLAWTNLTEALINQQQFTEVRAVFQDPIIKSLDWPEYIWEAWMAFEHLYGNVQEIEAANDKIGKAKYAVSARRAKESYQAMQVTMEQTANVSVTQAQSKITESERHSSVALMEVDSGPDEQYRLGTNELKRKADDTPAESSKKARIEESVPLKRDRENSTVFIANLPPQATEEQVNHLFKDCGKLREVKIIDLHGTFVATAEFNDRDSVPAALTKDKKKIGEQEIEVHLAWKSTLYVTNFPDKMDDDAVRTLFGKYGTIFDVRWPSKKFKNSRRFCYVQFTSPASAEDALQLNGLEIDSGQNMNVYISNPDRKKERSDADIPEKEIFVAGLSKSTTKADLEKIFKTYGPMKEIRMATEANGKAKGFAFIDFVEEKDAKAALAANNYELKGRHIGVTMSDPRTRSKKMNFHADTGLGRKAELRSRSVTVRNLPDGTQEGILQQALSKVARVMRVEVFRDKHEAIVELENAAEAGKLTLLQDPIEFNGKLLTISSQDNEELGKGMKAAVPPTKTGGSLFVPRTTVSRPRAGLGRSRKLGLGSRPAASTPPTESTTGKGQDDFRKMLGL